METSYEIKQTANKRELVYDNINCIGTKAIKLTLAETKENENKEYF